MTAARRSLPAVLLTAAILVPCGWLANTRLASYPPASTAAVLKFRELTAKPRHYELVIFGSSRAHFGVDPAHFPSSPSCLNLALPGCAMRMTRLVVETFLQSGNTADRVLLEVNPRSFDSRKLWRRPYHDAAVVGQEVAARIQRELYQDEPLAMARFQLETTPLWSRRAPPEWFFLGIDRRKPGRDPTDNLSGYSRGHVPLDDRAADSPPLREKTRKLTNRRNPLCSADVDALEAIIRTFKARGTDVILFETPVYRYETVGGPYQQYLEHIRNITATYGLPHLDYRTGTQMSRTNGDESNFFDHTHLSRSGVTLFSQELGRDVATLLAAGTGGTRAGRGSQRPPIHTSDSRQPQDRR